MLQVVNVLGGACPPPPLPRPSAATTLVNDHLLNTSMTLVSTSRCDADMHCRMFIVDHLNVSALTGSAEIDPVVMLANVSWSSN